jgi:signal transduction histidine kinase
LGRTVSNQPPPDNSRPPDGRRPARARLPGPSSAPARPAASGTSAELDRQRRRSDILLELSSTLAGVQDSNQIARIVSAFIRQASGAPFAMMGRRHPGTNRFAIAATEGLDPDQVGMIELALRTADRPSLRDLLQGMLTARAGEEAVGAGMGITSAMGAPIVIDGQVEGFIAVGGGPDDEVLPPDWQELLTAFAALTATAVARADAVGALARQRDVLASEVEERTRSLTTALDELRRASDAKTDFLANVSHELRTPLTSILGFVEVLASRLDGPLNDAQARDLETVRASSRHLLELIDDLIDISSIESGRIQLELGPVDVDAVIRAAAQTILPLAGAKGIALEVAPERDAGEGPVVAFADRDRLREIVLNLLSNAVKFTPSGGRVQVSAAVAEAPPETEATALRGPIVAITIRDSGPGIEVADQERIFEKFVRNAVAATPGTGLGLSISRELARLHGGDLTVESMPGLGSTFTVLLPQAVGR